MQNKFKVGDMVRVNYASIDSDLVGKILPVVRVTNGNIWLKGVTAPWSNPKNLELVSRKQEFNPGDRVRITTGICKGICGTVDRIEGERVWALWDDHRSIDFMPSDKVELLEKTEKSCSGDRLTIKDLERFHKSLFESTYWPISSFADWGMEETPKKETVSAKKVMAKIGLIARKLLDKDTKDLIKAGVLDEDLNVADDEFVLSYIVSHFKTELAVEARERLKEQKEDKG